MNVIKRNYVKCIAFLLSFFSPLVFSANQLSQDNIQDFHTNSSISQFSPFVVTLSGGPIWPNDGKTQTFYLAPELNKTYTAEHSTNTLAYGELFLGIQRQLHQKFKGQLGLALAATSAIEFSGDIWDDADPRFNNYTYEYHLKHTHIALEGKLLADTDFFVTPWVNASLGMGFNRAYGFDNTPTIFEAVKNPNFSSHTTKAFTYTLGVGVQRKLTDNCQVGASYQFADWGKSHLGRARGQTINSGLELDHLYTNGILFNITYIYP